MEPRRPEDGVPSRDIAAGFGPGRSDGMVAAKRRGDGVEAAGVLQALPLLPLLPGLPPLELGAGHRSRIGGYSGGPTTLFVSSVVELLRLKFKL